MNPDILSDPTAQAILLGFAAGATQLVSHKVTAESRATVLPLVFFFFAFIGALGASYVPPSLYPLVAFAGNAVATTGGIGLTGSLIKKASSTVEVLEKPVEFNS